GLLFGGELRRDLGLVDEVAGKRGVVLGGKVIPDLGDGLVAVFVERRVAQQPERGRRTGRNAVRPAQRPGGHGQPGSSCDLQKSPAGNFHSHPSSVSLGSVLSGQRTAPRAGHLLILSPRRRDRKSVVQGKEGRSGDGRL